MQILITGGSGFIGSHPGRLNAYQYGSRPSPCRAPVHKHAASWYRWTPAYGNRTAMWPDRRLLDLLGLDLPIIQAPMAGANDAAMAIAVSTAGGLGSLPCAMLNCGEIERGVARIRAATDRPFNLNFFCHVMAPADPAREG